MYGALSLPCGPEPALRADLFVPEDGGNRALTVCLPGGWWQGGAKVHQELRPLCLQLVEQGLPAATLALPPLGSGGGTALLATLTAACAALLDEAAVAGLDGRSLVVLGSGSGSLVALLLAAHLAELPRFRIRGAVAAGVTLVTDPARLPARARGPVQAFMPSGKPPLSPDALAPQALPPLLLLHQRADPEIPLAAVEAFASRQRAAGEAVELVLLPGEHHQWLEHPLSGVGPDTVTHLTTFLRTQTLVPETAESSRQPSCGEDGDAAR